MDFRRASILAVSLAVAVMAEPVRGQWGRGQYQMQQQQLQQSYQQKWGAPPGWATQAPANRFAPQPLRGPTQPGFQGLTSVAPLFSVFPSYPKGYGPPPRIGGFLPSEAPDPSGISWTPPALAKDHDGIWPSWIETGMPASTKAISAERAALARTSDRVWFLAPDDTAFVPLAFFDKFRLVESGSFIEVRNKGEFQVAFHDGAVIRSVGPIRLALPRLGSSLAELRLTTFRRFWLNAKVRPFVVVLPDGSRIELAGTNSYFERRGDRAVIFNHGRRAFRWVGRVGEHEVPPAHRVEIMLAGGQRPFLGSGLRMEGALNAEPDGRALAVRGGEGGGEVSWSGAKVTVPAGATVRLDPLAGSAFPQEK